MSIKNKIVAGAVVIAVALGMTMQASATALTMDLLLALGLSQSQASAILAATSGSTTSAYNHTITLRSGMRGSAVSALQTCLNSKGYNVGSADGSYGPMTMAGVRAFQTSKGLTADGVVGAMTGPAVSAACAVAVVPDDSDDDSDDDSSDIDLEDFIIEGGSEASVEDFDGKNGNDSDVLEGDTGKEIARFEVTWEDSDVLLERIDFMFDPATANAEDDPTNDIFEDIVLLIDGEEVDTVDASDDDNWDDDIYDGDDTDTTLDDYSLRFSGINKILKEGDEAVITVEADISSNIESAPEEWEISIPTEGMRVTDTAGITGYAGDTSDPATVTLDAEGTDNEFTVREGDDNPDASAVEVDDSNRTKVTVLEFEIEADEDGEDLQINDIGIQADLTDGTLGGSVNETYATVVYETILEIDGEEYDVDTIVATTTTATECDLSATAGNTSFAESDEDPCLEWNFEKNEVVIPSGETVIAKLIIEVNELDNTSNYDGGQILSADVDADDIDVEGDDTKEAVTDLNGAVTGDDQSLLVEGIIVTPGTMDAESISVDSTNNDYAELTIGFDVEAFGTDVWVTNLTTNTDFDDDAVVTAPTTAEGVGFHIQMTAGTATTPTATLSSTADEDASGVTFKVNEGDTETFTLQIIVPNTSGNLDDDSVRAILAGIGWDDADDNNTTADAVYTLNLTQDYKTAYGHIVD